MIQANLVAEDQYFDASRSRDPDHLRGQFVPWAHLEIPDGGWTFKLARGTLLVSDANSASLYAVEKAELQQSIDIGGHHWGRFRYADASEQHIFIVSTFQLNVYDRADGSRVLMIPAGRLPWDYYATPENQWRYTEETFNHGEPNFRRDVSPNPVDREDYFYTGAWSRILYTVVIQHPHVKFVFPLAENIWQWHLATGSSLSRTSGDS